MANKYEDYIDGTGHLSAAWEEIQNNPNGETAKYWKDRGATSKAAFGAAHAKETNDLITGDYQKKHGSGSTKVKAGEDTSFARRAIPNLEKADVKSDRITATTESVKQGSGETTQYSQSDIDTILGDSPFSSGRTAGKNIYTSQSGVDYEAYVDMYPDLQSAWRQIVANPYGEQARYWIPRMGVTDPSEITKEAFGIAHRGENAKLFAGTYKGETWTDDSPEDRARWMEGKDKDTGQRDPDSDYWKDKINTGGSTPSGSGSTPSGSGSTPSGSGSSPSGWGPGGPGGSTAGEMLATPYTQPGLLDWSQYMPEDTPLQAQRGLVANQGAYYQPWATGQQTPTALIDYAVPTNVGYKPTFVAPNLNNPPVVVPQAKPNVVPPYIPPAGGGGGGYVPSLASDYQQWDWGAEESADPNTAFTMEDLEAMQAEAARSANRAATRMALDSTVMEAGPPGLIPVQGNGPY